VKHRVTGLFDVEREADFRETMKVIVHVDLVSVDSKTGIAEFRLNERQAFGQGTPQQMVERFDNQVREASRGSFGIRPLSTVPPEKVTRIEIPVAGLDCKACCLAAYEAIFKIDGVEHANVSFREGKVTAWIDGEKTNRAALEDSLRKKGVDVPKESP
jgi:copper chaperone CopZ